MAAVISRVEKHSPAAKAHIKQGETLLSINGERVVDVLDYKFLSYDAALSLEIEGTDGARRTVRIRKEEGEDLGITFYTYLIDKMKRCANKCVFCFIDQMPRGMRDTLYVKDDDARMSFLLGNYISLTNLAKRDVDRMIRMRISPVNISVQTTNPELRVKMLGNPNAGKSLDILKAFADANLRMNAQIVVCPGLNDGQELERTLSDLTALYPCVQSISVVPVGLTAHREGLYPLKPVEKKEALEILEITQRFGDRCMEQFASRVVFPSDELYLKAELPYPDAEFYEDFPQYENGVGMLASFEADFRARVDAAKRLRMHSRTLLTGVLAAPFLQTQIDYAKRKCDNQDYEIRMIQNDFFGKSVTVAGLLTGMDLLREVRENPPQYRAVIPACMLRFDRDMFLDSVTVETLRAAVPHGLSVIETDPDSFFDELFEEI